MSTPLPALKVLVAFNNNAFDDPALITSFAGPPGTLGGNSVWTDVTKFVKRVKITRGRKHELARFEAGECRLELNNDDGRFNPWNLSSPYATLIAVGVPVQIRATYTPTGGSPTTYTLFTGQAHNFKPLWPNNFEGDLELIAADAFRLLALSNIPAPSAYAAAVLALNPTNYWRLGDLDDTAADLGSAPNPGTYHGLALTEVDVATTANVTLAGEQTIDGVVTDQSRVLVKNQTSPAQNGVYITTSTSLSNPTGAWSRAPDASSSSGLSLASVAVIGGTQGFASVGTHVYAMVWISNSVSTVGTDPVTWGQVGYPGATRAVSNGALIGEPGAGCFDAGNIPPLGGFSSAGFITLNNPQPFPSGNAWSLAFWAKINPNPGQGYFNALAAGTNLVVYSNSQGVGGALSRMSVGFDNFNGGGFLVAGAQSGINFSAHDGVSGRTFTFHNTGSGTNTTAATVPFNAGSTINDGLWHHIVCVMSNATTGAGAMYVDGGQTPLTAFTGTAFPVILTGNGVTATIAGQGTAVGDFPGSLQEFSIFPTALTAAQALSLYSSGAGLPWVGHLSGERINAVLDAVGWPSLVTMPAEPLPGPRTIDGGDSTNPLIGYSGGLTTKALAHLQQVERTEGGALFTTKAGGIKFVSRANLMAAPYTTVQAAFDDVAGSGNLRYREDIDQGEDDLDVYNAVTVSNEGQAQYTKTDTASIARYGYRALDVTGLLGSNSKAAKARATALVNQFKTPLTRVRRMTIHPMDDPDRLYPEVLGRELLDLITLIRTGISGDPVNTNATVEYIEHTADADGWETHYGLGQALPPA